MSKTNFFRKRLERCLFGWNVVNLTALALGFVLIGCNIGSVGSDSHLFNATSEVFYYSDYFSFIGEDEYGRVAFALDNNRGRDGDTWQAEHFVVMHDEHRGWINVSGNGAYENREHKLESIPNSSTFRFSGSPETGLTISSSENKITLELASLAERFTRTHKDAIYRMGSGTGILEWGSRRLKGRVIYEYLYIPGFNRLTRSYPGLWKEFHGIYAQAGNSGDLYWHTHQSPVLKALTGNSEGFFFHNGETVRLKDLEVSVKKRVQAKGSYRWPIHWSGQWQRGRSSFRIKLSDLKVISSWIVGGFSMGIVKGEIKHGTYTLTLYGLGELLI